MINTILLLVIALAEFLRLWVTYKPQTKKQYFKNRLHAVRQMIWDIEFKIFKTKEIREGVRQDYDAMKSRLSNYEKILNEWKGKDDEAEKKRVEDDIVRAKQDVERLEAQMKQVDLEVYGSKKTAEFPDGATGLTHEVESLRELTGMLDDWLKKI